MFVGNPDSYLLPSYRISPFTTYGIKRNRTLSPENVIVAKNYLDERFGEGNWIITQSGRSAIDIIFKSNRLANSISSGSRAIVPSSLRISTITPASS